MNKKNGFTLVELLAVIVILAVLVLLAVPSVLKMMNNAKNNAFKIEAENIGKAAKSAYANDLLNSDTTRETGTGYCYSISYLKASGYIDKEFESENKGSVLVNGSESLIWYTDGTKSVTGKKLGEVSLDSSMQGSTLGYNDCSGAIGIYIESTLNGAYPRLDSGMIPVTIGNDGIAKTVDPSSSSWYSYSSQRWANVVLVKESGTRTRAYYKSNYNVTVNEADILAYLVWIPRYRYTLWNVSGKAATYTGGCSITTYYSASTCTSNGGTWQEPNCTANCPQTISITFESAYTAKSTGTTNGTELTHPAFTYDGRELNGIWVGKFETTQGTTLNVGTTNPTIKPNITSWTNQNVSTQFTTSLLFNSNSAYGITSESRMSKNSDWGAIVYLSHSIYGLGNNEIRINNYWNSGTKTGCGASAADLAQSTTCAIEYGKVLSYPQSTTGNISGIFDMSGGAVEYQMGVITDESNNKYSGRCDYYVYNSGFKGIYSNPNLNPNCNSSVTNNTTGLDYPNAKYYKMYTTTNWSINPTNLGEAFGETNGWYKDRRDFVEVFGNWYFRGGYTTTGVISGGFNFHTHYGSANLNAFRVIITTA